MRAWAGTLSNIVREGIFGVASIGALPLGFQVKLGLVRGKYLPAGLHAAESSYVFSSSISAFRAAIVRAVSSSISAFRAAIVRAVWSSKMPLAHAPAILNLLVGLFGVDPAFHSIWSRFRMMRRYLASYPEEEPGFFWISSLGAPKVMVRSSSSYHCC